MSKNSSQALLVGVNFTFLLSQKTTCVKITLSFSSNITVTAGEKSTLVNLQSQKGHFNWWQIIQTSHALQFTKSQKVESENQSSFSNIVSLSLTKNHSSVRDTLSLVKWDGDWIKLAATSNLFVFIILDLPFYAKTNCGNGINELCFW